MNFAVFLLLFVVIFVLIAVVVWVLKTPREEGFTQEEEYEDMLPTSSDDPDEARQWLEEFARRQEESGNKRLH